MIQRSIYQDSIHISNIHQQAITEGFLPKLGVGFLMSLSRYLVQHELVLVYKEDQRVLGFVSCAISSKGMMKRFILSSPRGICKLVIAVLKNPLLIKPLWETFCALTHSKSDELMELPETELLSIAVSTDVQKNGVGSALLKALEEALRNRDIYKYKVIAGDKLIGANEFYIKHGFSLAKQITIHGDDISNVYVKTITRDCSI